jgi:membrane-associated protease RseP (regulator of RpoE activity)
MLLEAFAILVMLGILSVLIIVHEFGHFSVARFFGFQTPVFGIGLPFGPYWVVGHKWGTQFRIHAALLGGYVAIPELGDESNAREDTYGVPLSPFRKFPIWQRALVAFAGVGFNIIFAWIVMFTMLATMGEPVQNVVVQQLPPENPIAAQAGIKAGDKVLRIDNTTVGTPDDLVGYLGKRPNTQVTVHVMRGKEPKDITMTTNAKGKVGMALITKGPIHYNKIEDASPIALAAMSTDRLVKLTGNMVDALGMMAQNIGNSITHPQEKKVPGAKPQMGIEDVHGVLAVVKIGADIAKQDWSQLFLFTIMISMDLAIINLLPWPALDGGHLAFMAFEAVRGKPMEERHQGEIVKWGFLSLLLLMAVIMFNDVKALVTGKLDFKPDKDEEISAPAPADKQPPAGTTGGSAAPKVPVQVPAAKTAPDASAPAAEPSEQPADKTAPAPSAEPAEAPKQ